MNNRGSNAPQLENGMKINVIVNGDTTGTINCEMERAEALMAREVKICCHSHDENGLSVIREGIITEILD